MSEPVRDPVQIAVPVEGGELSALHWPADAPGAPIVVLVHGITANAMSWARVGAALAGDVEVVAPDLRGRAGSAGLPGPYGLDAHAADLTALLDSLGADGDGGAESTVLVGHSMGAFVATLAAAGPARDRVHGLVLVDGGLAFPQPPGADLDAMLAAVLGPALDRLSMTFPDLAAVRAFWAQHPAVGPWVDVPSVAAYLARDVTGEPPALRSACVPEAVRVDGGDVLANERVLEATTDLPVPATLLWATRGMFDQTPGLYDQVRLAQLGLEPAGITAREVPDTNHYSILWAAQGVEAITAAVRAAAARR
ncbi:alpha/beta fold hydrolase [Geodermatophilus sp. CPCC 206100]|uniref:alpha/beta fold hydrolase n=1 Tax=Geodermatophilus sp. CPCC 206100 TaxID=3020054 RepID=UPI003B00AFCD